MRRPRQGARGVERGADLRGWPSSNPSPPGRGGNPAGATLQNSRQREPSHRRGAPEVPEPLALGAQYFTRYNIWKKFVRATRPALACASPKTSTWYYTRKFFILTGSSLLKELNWSETFVPTISATPTPGRLARQA